VIPPLSSANESLSSPSNSGPERLSHRGFFAVKRLIPLILLTFIYSVGLSVLASRGVGTPAGANLLWRVIFALLMVRWVEVDRRTRRFHPPYEFGAFVFFAWKVVVPYYLIKTRGARGLIGTLGFWALAITPELISRIILLFFSR
jgi:hypothetical protein